MVLNHGYRRCCTGISLTTAQNFFFNCRNFEERLQMRRSNQPTACALIAPRNAISAGESENTVACSIALFKRTRPSSNQWQCINSIFLPTNFSIFTISDFSDGVKSPKSANLKIMQQQLVDVFFPCGTVKHIVPTDNAGKFIRYSLPNNLFIFSQNNIVNKIKNNFVLPNVLK